MKFWVFYRTVSRRRWIVVCLLVVTLVSVYLSTRNQQPLYQATVQLMPSDTALYRPIVPSPTASVTGALGEGRTSSQLPNLMSLIKSRSVAERTIRVSGMKEEPDSLIRRISVSTATNPGAHTRQEIGTDIIEIKVFDAQPARAVRTVNALAHVFAGFYQEISHREAYGTRRFLESELVRARRELERASSDLREYKKRNRVTSIGDATSAASQELRGAIAQRDAARASLAEIQAKLSDVNRQLRVVGPTRTIQEGTSNTPMAQQLEAQLARLMTELNDARAKYEDTHPVVVAIKENIAQVQTKLNAEAGNVKTNLMIVRNPVYDGLLQQKSQLAAERDGLAARVRQLERNVARSAATLRPGSDVTLARLESAFAAAQTNFSSFQNQLNQARVNEKETSGTGEIRIVDEAARADGPIGTSRSVYFLLGTLLSLVVGVGLAVTLDSLDNRLKSTHDVEKLLGLPVTAMIPRSIGSGNSALARVTYAEPLSPISEAYRFLRTDLLLCAAATGAKTIMVATAKPGQGGTVTVANLGIALAVDGKRVVLVDGDMRRASLHRIFKASNEYGLSSVLSGEKNVEEVIFSTEIENLLIIPAGPEPTNPSELLGSARMASLASQLAEHADFVLFDTPSAIAFTDAVVLSRIVDGVILVVRAHQVPRSAELQVRNLLDKAHANILGVVLNDVQPEMVDSYYYHSHYYPDDSYRRVSGVLRGSGGTPSLPITR